MTSKEKAERLASDAAAEMPGYVETGGEVYRFDNSDAANKISEICCLPEFFDVAESAKDCLFYDNREKRQLEQALATLKKKLPKGMM